MKASSWKNSWFLSLLLLVVLIAPAGAQEAQNPATDLCLQDGECASHFRQARRLSKAGQLDAAVEEYRVAYQRRAVPWLLFNIGRSLHKLGRTQEAVQYYQRFLATDQGSNPEWQDKARGFLEEAQREAAASPASPAGAQATTAPTGPPPRPIYKRWWFWTVLGGVVAGGVITGVVLGTRPVTPANAEVYQPTF